MADLIITAPVKGWAAPLSEVPDPVFADRMMGDGVAIHPAGSTVVAPCDGVVAALHAARHAVTVRHQSGAEILIHIGLETVALGGKGFRALTVEGASVSRGDPLIEFDMDAVALGAVSLVTPVVVTNGDAFLIERRTVGQKVETGDALMVLSPITPPLWSAIDGDTFTRTVAIPLAHGIHARPAARIGAAARAFDAQVEIVSGDRRVNAHHAVALMGLGLGQGEQVVIEARGREAEAALAAVGDLIEGMEEAVAAAPMATPPAEIPEGALAGVTAASGLAIGRAAWLAAEAIEIAPDAADAAAESAALDAALERVRNRIATAADGDSEAQCHILDAHLAFLGDADLLAAARTRIAAGRSAGQGWREAIAAQTAQLRASGNPRFAERAADLEDLDHQVQLALLGRAPEARRFAPGTILLANDLLPSQLIALDANVTGIVLAAGGPTSHAAILAAARGLPMLVATGAALAAIEAGTPLVLDADAGLLHVAPSAEAVDAQRERFVQRESVRAAALAAAHDPCCAADGTRIELFANLGSVDDAILAAEQGAEGSGLVRTEFLFMDRAAAPGEDEQCATYQAIADAMTGRPVIIRLLDIGGDKPAPWLPMAVERNPMLGVRGVRVSLAHPELLDVQLRAILRVKGDCRIMAPMISGLDELRAVRAALARAAAELGLPAAPLGVMIETPAAATIADLIAAEADFLSIGTNDLTQYTLAMDRENGAVAAGVDALHPAVLRLIAMSCVGGAGHRRPVGVCGGLASDRLGIPLLLGLGVTELSVAPGFVPEAKALVRRLDLATCRTLADRALALGSAAEIRALVRATLEELN
ncbi:phosphoenolpyruvate--protein phosphotransferase [Sphingomonas sp. LB-2]|uniref:phosphoenolpyruvate--protein phosphotransferase n=1 Tax=Sphingomonas caeni TaxID=2984949 RepID=UPI00222FBD67|nr:phosphoenolpyruvate--protein phosphotransferase [Sphingomonas caeni]MCW3848034.1 phosphoenolpyruvate--protein phosphotransferase [Sphingomonas caeni]